MSLSKEIQQLLDNVIDTLVKWDLIVYLQKHPSAHISAGEIASSIGRNAEEVIAALADLSQKNIVQYESDGEAIYYRFNPSRDWQKHIAKFTEGLENRNTRWLILNYLVERNG